MQELPDYFIKALKQYGQKEIKGALHNLEILKYHNSVDMKPSADEVPWCSSFLNWCMKDSGLHGTNSAAAMSWTKWGRRCYAHLGCVVIIKRGSESWQAHVGLYVKEEGGHVYILGGNQSDHVNISKYPSELILDLREHAPLSLVGSSVPVSQR